MKLRRGRGGGVKESGEEKRVGKKCRENRSTTVNTIYEKIMP